MTDIGQRGLEVGMTRRIVNFLFIVLGMMDSLQINYNLCTQGRYIGLEWSQRITQDHTGSSVYNCNSLLSRSLVNYEAILNVWHSHHDHSWSQVVHYGSLPFLMIHDDPADSCMIPQDYSTWGDWFYILSNFTQHTPRDWAFDFFWVTVKVLVKLFRCFVHWFDRCHWWFKVRSHSQDWTGVEPEITGGGPNCNSG